MGHVRVLDTQPGVGGGGIHAHLVRPRALTAVFAAAAALVLSGCVSEQESPPSFLTEGNSFAVTNAVVFDGEQIPDADTVVVRDGLIDAVTSTVPDDVTAVDAGGRVLLPGLIDAHAHQTRRLAPPALRFGTTTMLNMFGPVDSTHQRQRASMDPPVRADVWTAGTLVTAPGGHGTQYGRRIPTVDADTDIDAFVADRLEEGSDFIKLVIEDGSLYGGDVNTLTPEEVRAVVTAAHDRGVLTVAHVSTWEDVAIAAEADIDALAHSPADAPVDRATVQALAEEDTPVVATVVVRSSASCSHDSRDFITNESIEPYLTAAQIRDAHNHSYGACYESILPAAMDNVAALHEAGVSILVGTDAGNPGTLTGVSMLHEMQLLSDAGLAPTEILAGATSGPADLFGLDDRGRIAEDLRADLVLTDVTSVDEVPGSYDIAAIWKNGYAVDRSPPGSTADPTP